MNTLTRQALAGLRMILVLTVILGIIYPLAVWAVAHLPGLSGRAEGSVITANGAPVGSSLIGVDPVPANPAADPYFHARPSASAKDVLGPGDPSTSGGTNLAGDSDKLLKAVVQRREQIAAREGVAPASVPADAVTASASGMDPQISSAYAELQVARVARVTGLPVDQVRGLVDEHTQGRFAGVLGEPGVNVTELNLAVAAARAR
ncbi:K(+)-transporting ATPase subunit C [Pseudonocardia acaciae]|uniref:K(+)-transporting ATPase subunit C n=1 Tax=Pseudonocardia acaciae TaxID=551276 RepID=UPI00048D3F3D|nr:K(+)-transporting ATPase subunit C [Pseudonocardia acaciae]